ncbi:TadE/TadG family type IV pilus assembly protein [Amnibacterium endophyticum]|uniref:TadE/TadG family type IV pilus assembly protein n=1 Tax=Amnibacterium endophyticum TaxID=2109337 RepID=A0ABW4L9K6_9MICO
MRDRLHDDRGAAAVEFALIFSLILAPLTVGVLEYGRAYAAQLTVTNAARVAARSLVVTGSATQARLAAVTAAVGLPNPAAISVAGLVPCPTDGTTPTRTVTVTYALPSLTGLFPATSPRGTGAMLCNS